MPFTRITAARASLMVAVSTMALAAAGSTLAQTRHFNVPAQAAATGVPEFARQANLQILAPAEAVAGRRTAAVQGVFGVDQGLSRLLTGSNLVIASNDSRTAVLAAASPIIQVSSASQSAPPQEQSADAEASVVDEVVVTGFRASLRSALSAKRGANGVVDAIKAEDIADFPDANLAESIQRVPGVSITRVAGEGRTITVRGLPPTFTRVRINGMEAQSTSGATTSDRGANLGRGFDFNTFASELFSGITVRKTAQAEVIEGSLGATVDLETAATPGWTESSAPWFRSPTPSAAFWKKATAPAAG
jgi:iron complex outermembrane receptor protein